MRIAFGTNPAHGHLLPLVPLAFAARDAGHDVAVITGASMRPIVERVGLRFVEAGPPDLATAFEAIGIERYQGSRRALHVWSRAFADEFARPLAHGLLDLARSWRPDLVVHEDTEQGTWIASERLGIPHLTVEAAAWRGSMLRLSREPANRLRAALGLDPDPQLRTWHRYGFLTTRPPSLRNPADPMPAGTTELRPVASEDGPEVDASWLDRPTGGRPRIAATLGTVNRERRGDLLGSLVDALEPLDAEVVVALGPGLDPADFGPRAANVRLVPYVPMSRLLPASDLVVCHAGSGTVLAALGAGRPLVLLPTAADQPQNADACRAAGVAVVIEPDEWGAETIRAAVTTVLEDPGMRDAAGRIRDEIDGMPAPGIVVRRLEALVATQRT